MPTIPGYAGGAGGKVPSKPKKLMPIQPISGPTGQYGNQLRQTAPKATTPATPIAQTQGNAPGGPQYPGAVPSSLYQSSAPGSLPPQGSNPYHGFAAQFNPGALQQQIWQDPQMVLNAMYQQSGQGTSSPMYSTLRDFYGADPQSLWLLTQGTTPGKFGDAGSYANFLNAMYSSYQTPGGRAFSFPEILQNLQGVTDQSGVDPQYQSPLYQILTAGNASDQARTMYGLVGDAAKVGLSPAIASAFMNSLANETDRYLTSNAQSQGGQNPFYQYFQNPMTPMR